MSGRRRNLIVLIVVLLLAAVSAYAIKSNGTKEGIDLKGGTELVYQARGTPQNPTVDADDINRAIEIMRERIDQFGVAEPEISRIGEDQISVQLPDVQNAKDAIDQIGTTAQLFFYDFEKNVIPQKRLGKADAGDEAGPPYTRLFNAVQAAEKEKPECFKDECTTTGPTYYLFGKTSQLLKAGPSETKKDLFLQFPKREQPADTVVKSVPQGTVVLENAPADGTPDATASDNGTSPDGYFVLKDRPALSGKDITDPQQNFDPNTNQPNVTFSFTDKGRQAFQDVTREIAQRGAAKPQAIGVTDANTAAQLSDSFAVALDGQIKSRAIINFVENPDGIDGRTGAEISGIGDLTEAQNLAEVLKIGALPVKLSLISQSTVSATLGQDALNGAIKAGLAGLAIVVLFLLLYYRFLGLVAALGLVVYALFFLAMIKVIPITLTLPGIAGLVLTIGVAADANIVIFERIKEEVRLGRSMLSAISQGYRKGIATIIDANVITLLTAFILFGLATATVKGFAFTLGIGTIVSLFTAVLFTQAILGVLGRAKFLRSPAFLGARENAHTWTFDFSGAARWFFSFSGVILAIGSIAFATKQLNLGIDFESGSRITVGLNASANDATPENIRNTLSDAGVSHAGDAEIQEVDNKQLAGDSAVQINGDFGPNEVTDLRGALNDSYGVADFQNTSIGPTFGAEIARKAVIAIIFSLLVIAVYVALRFEAKYAVPVLIALIHDILITGGVYALSGLEVSSATVAAFLTILGYSMYDTIIVFDRVRENVPRMPRAAFSQIVNRSMSEVLTRSLITGISTVFLIGVLLVFGGETLRTFAFAMMVGVASGTYSSIFIAAPVLTEWKEREPAYRSRRAHIVETMGYVPTFPEDNVVARVNEPTQEPALVGGGPEPRGEVPHDTVHAPPPTGAPETTPLAPEPKHSRPVTGRGEIMPEHLGGEREPTPEEEAARLAERAEKKRRRERNKQRGRKHGRRR
jgi:SecD/SecF fusion protein